MEMGYFGFKEEGKGISRYLRLVHKALVELLHCVKVKQLVDELSP